MLMVRMAREIPGSLDIHGDLLMPYQRNTVQQRRLHSDRVVQNIVLFAHTMYVCKNVYLHTSCTLTISLGVIKNVENVWTFVEKSMLQSSNSQICKGLLRTTNAKWGLHTTYSWNIKWQKCAGIGLNGFILEKINENVKEKKILGAN